jgi:hypothetical protein
VEQQHIARHVQLEQVRLVTPSTISQATTPSTPTMPKCSLPRPSTIRTSVILHLQIVLQDLYGRSPPSQRPPRRRTDTQAEADVTVCGRIERHRQRNEESAAGQTKGQMLQVLQVLQRLSPPPGQLKCSRGRATSLPSTQAGGRARGYTNTWNSLIAFTVVSCRHRLIL